MANCYLLGLGSKEYSFSKVNEFMQSTTDKQQLQYSYFHQIQNKYQKSKTIRFDQI